MFKNYNNLGFHSKYYTIKDTKIDINTTFSNSISTIKNKEIDVTAIIEFINRFYFFSDRTIIKTLLKTPWLAKSNTSFTKREYNKIIDEPLPIKSEEEFFNIFIEKIKNEIVSYIGESKSIGILLTGGMDSRVVAAIVNKLNNNNRINTKVQALTWGMENSRDVVYAQRIAEKYNWGFKSFELTPEILKENIEVTANEGCEFSPIHLHGMINISKQSGLDLILAGSFGDSIGRAEYSGTHASKLSSLGDGISNKFFFIKKSNINAHISDVKGDIKRYSELFKRKLTYSNYEIEQMAHYMRKELNPCMTLIDRKIPLFQVFSAPEVYNFVLNVPIKYRNDKLYYNVLKTVDSSLLEIPWARTGKQYLNEENSTIDTQYTKKYHQYGKWIRNDLADYINELIFNGNIEKLNIFNMKAIKYAIKINKKSKTNNSNRIDELIVWLASLSLMIEKHNIKGVKNQKNKSNDYISLLKSKIYTLLYIKLTNLKTRI